MQRQGKTAISPGTLSTDFSILSTSPAWPEVERVVKDLVDKGDELDEHTREQHVQILRSYAQLLRNQQLVIAQGILCGVLVGRASGRQAFADALYFGLTALQRSCGFDSSSAREVIGQLMTEAQNQFPEQVASVGDFPGSFDEPERWLEWAQRINEAMEIDALASLAPIGGLRQSAWEGWDERLRQHLGLQEAARLPGLVDAICFDSDQSPANLLSHPVASMNLRQWSLCLLAGLSDRKFTDAEYAPIWLTIASACRLGFPGLAHSVLDNIDSIGKSGSGFGKRDLDVESAMIDSWRESLESTQLATRPAIILITNEESVCDSWHTGTVATGINVRPGELDTLASIIMPWPDSIDFVVVERPQPDDRDTKSLLKSLRDSASLVPGKQLFDLLQKPPKTKHARPFVVAPSGGIDELHRVLSEQRRESMKKAR